MTRRTRTAFFILPALLFAGPASAASMAGSHIDRVRLDDNGDALVTLEDVKPPTSCRKRDEFRLVSETPNFRYLYSMVLVAHLAHQKIRLDVDDTKCATGLPSIIAVNIED